MRDLVETVYDPPRADPPWRLEDLLSEGLIRYYSLGRWALAAALRACGIGEGDRVLLPGLICRELLAPLDAIKAQCVFYAVSDRLCMEIDPYSLPAARAIVAVNYFGFPQDLDPFREYCRRTSAVLIEDNAQGLFSRDCDGRWLGTRGDMGIFSLRKTIALPNGGALVMPSNSRVRPEPQLEFDSSWPMGWYRVKQVLRVMVPRLGHKRFRVLIGCVRQLKEIGPARRFAMARTRKEASLLESSRPCSLLAEPIVFADPDKEADRRRALYDLANEIVSSSGGKPVFGDLPENVVPYVFPFYGQGSALRRTHKALAREGLDCFRWPELPAAVESAAPEHYKTLWGVRFLW